MKTKSLLLAVSIALPVIVPAAALGAGEESKARASGMKERTVEPLQVRLGYPRNAKLLILNADDLAVSHSENEASLTALEHKWITSGTVMVPCPWFTEVA